MDHTSHLARLATPSGENPYPTPRRMTAEEEREVKATAKNEPYKPRHARSVK